jgi:hypothetical protein
VRYGPKVERQRYQNLFTRTANKGKAWLTAIVRADEKLHTELYSKFPTSMRVGGWILRRLYGGAVSPAFAVILGLLLVGLVISGVGPIIVSMSVFAAWLVVNLALAKADWVNF